MGVPSGGISFGRVVFRRFVGLRPPHLRLLRDTPSGGTMRHKDTLCNATSLS